MLSLGRSLSSDSGTLVTATRSKKKSKRDKAVALAFDLNLSPGEAEDEEEAVPSDLTQEGDSGSPLRPALHKKVPRVLAPSLPDSGCVCQSTRKNYI